MTWTRPVPTVGDTTSAAERAADPAGWAFPDADVEALHRILGARRDVRRFRPDPVAPATVRRLLGAAHRAPSVGHSQPWRWVVVEDPTTRQRAATLADQQRLAQAAALDAESGRQLLDLDLEGIREAPVGIVVCCDRRVPAAGVLGRATFGDADVWSCACAIENLWLAARAEGLGVGWVTLFRPGDLAALVGAPEGVTTLGWLCVGWPDERPPAPGLERRGWSSRRPLDEVVLHERWPPQADAVAPPASRLGPPASRLAPASRLGPPASRLAPPAPAAIVAARDEADRLLTPPGSLGVLDRMVDRLAALGLGHLAGGTLVIAAADHPVTVHGVSAYPAHVTRDVADAAVAGRAVGAVAAATAGLDVVVVDAGVAPAGAARHADADPVAGALVVRALDRRGDLVAGDALSAADVDRLVGAGRALGADLAGRGVVAVGEAGVGNTTLAAALAALSLGLDPGRVVGLGSGADRSIVDAKIAVVGAVVRRAAGRPPTPAARLALAGGPELAVLCGIVAGVAGAGGVVVLDGLATSVAALLAVADEPAVAAHLVAGQRSREPAHGPVLDALGLEPLLDLRIRAGEGAGAALATGLLLAAARVRVGAARVAPR